MVEKLNALLYSALLASSPVLSGNMRSMIQISRFGVGECEIIIDAPFYDSKLWNKNKIVVHTGKNINGVTAYANYVNELGAFGRHNKSEHWVNRVILDVCSAIANEVGGEVINELPL